MISIDTTTFFKRTLTSLRNTSVGRMFIHKKFAHYFWISVFVSLFNIFLLWLFIDIVGIPTIISSVIVIGSTFIFRYVLFDFFKIM